MKRLVRICESSYKTKLMPVAKEAKESFVNNDNEIYKFLSHLSYGDLQDVNEDDWKNYVDNNDVLEKIFDDFVAVAIVDINVSDEEEFFEKTGIEFEEWINFLKDIKIDECNFDEIKKEFLEGVEESNNPYSSKGISKKDFY